MAALPFKVKAVYEYNSGHDDDLSFAVGDVITVTELEGDDWYVGKYTDASGVAKEGLFPQNFVEKYEPEVPTRPARPTRPKQDAQPVPVQPPLASEREEQEDLPPVPAASKPHAPPVETSNIAGDYEDVRSPPSATSQKAPSASLEPPPAPKPAPAEPETATPAKTAPPPVAPKSSSFKDRIAAFNKVEQQPIKPMVPGKQGVAGGFIKKPFVAPPPSSNSYIPPVVKHEPVHRPYMREEDPEIKRQQEDDRAAAEAAGLLNEPSQEASEPTEDEPKPMSLKERMAMLQEQQRLAAERNAEASQRKEKKTVAKKPSQVSVPTQSMEEDEEDQEPATTPGARERPSMDSTRERPPVPLLPRRTQEPMSPIPAVPQHEIVSGGEEADQSAADETTEDDADTIAPDDEDRSSHAIPRAAAAPSHEADVGNQDDTAEDDGAEDEEEELDEEELRKQRLRERMARLAGPQGGAGVPFNPFGAPPPPAPTKKRSITRKASGDSEATIPTPQRVPIMPMPGMQRVRSQDSDVTERIREEEATTPGEETEHPVPPPRRSMTGDRGAAPSVPTDRPIPEPPSQQRGAPPPLPGDSTRPRQSTEGRAVPPPPPSAVPRSLGPGSESDDERSMHARMSSAEASGVDTSGAEAALPIRPAMASPRDLPPRPPQSPESKRTSYFQSEPSSATSEKRNSRVPPPIPGLPMSPRPPPPPPPTAAPPSRQGTGPEQSALNDTERGESEYEGDYDTDIASSAKHKDALKGHAREPSYDDSTTADEISQEQIPGAVPFMPPTPGQQPRAVPPPPPTNKSTPKSRSSVDAPRAPPPVPPTAAQGAEGDYDPYRYNGPNQSVPPVPSGAPILIPSMLHEEDDEESSADDMPRQSIDRAPPPPPHAAPPQRVVSHPPPPPPSSAPQAPPPTEAPSRQSLQVQRTPTTGRRSMDQPRPSGDQIAADVDLAPNTTWWAAPHPLPPVFQSRNGIDILSESEESTTTKRGGRSTVSKDIYVLFMDYSQTIITARYDSRDPADVTLEQRHEPPPPKLRQDQLEAYWQRFGANIAENARQAASGKKDSVVGDGSPTALPATLIASQTSALLPVGGRGYGALVYANLANASTMQFDEIRPGDIITVRNAKFEGHHGAMRQKYKQDFGAGHVAVVEEWDGTKRSVRAWEQGREKKGGVRSEKFRLGDLRSGEVRVWRVVGRDWVGWE